MLATKITCPHCHKHLKMAKPPVAGHRVLCSRCGRSFTISSDAIVSAAGGAPPAPAAVTHKPTPPPVLSPRLDPAHAAEGDDTEASSPGAPQRLWIALILGGLLLLLTTTVGLVLFFALRKGPHNDTSPAVASSSSGDETSSSGTSRKGVPPPSSGASDDDPRLLRDPTLTPTSTSAEKGHEAWLPPEEQERVNKAIDTGVQWLKKHQGEKGSWGPRVGLAALPALTLLECGVPGDDIRIQKAVHHVRKAIPSLNATYDLALAILFLDRLGDPADKTLIQTCALRLVAGQSPTGGWTYNCPLLSPQHEKDLLLVMRERRPASSMDLFVGGPDGSAPPGFITRDPSSPLNKDIQGDPSGDSKLLPQEGPSGGLLTKERPSPEEAKRALNRLPAELRKLPSLQPPQQSHKMPRGDGNRTDNSNTQFAILGLLAAARYDLPLERAYALIVQRFHVSQAADGQWHYNYSSPGHPGGSPAMTGAGLLGLAVQYGLGLDQERSGRKGGQVQDPAVEKGFKSLAHNIGKPLGAKQARSRKNGPLNYYFLWSVERCGVLYKRRQIDGKDWYLWGAELLVDHQQPDGHWMHGNYPGSPQPIADTCFALLFLKRANLAKDLTKKLEFFMEGKQLQTGP